MEEVRLVNPVPDSIVSEVGLPVTDQRATAEIGLLADTMTPYPSSIACTENTHMNRNIKYYV